MTEPRQWTWHSLGEPEGKGFADTIRRYDRLPTRAQSRVPEIVWNLSRNSSSLFSRFRTDATSIAARWRIDGEVLALSHMPATAVSGLDLYGEADDGKIHWVGVGHPTTIGVNNAVIAEEIDGMNRNYTVYFPLFNNLEDVQVGVPLGASFEIVPPDPLTPVVYYGTSIIHGASASRPGMALPAQLGRRLGRNVIGLGFSGNGKMEVEIAEHLSEIQAAIYIIDCLPNMDHDLVRERTVPFVQALRAVQPETPILLVEDRTFTNAWAIPAKQELHRRKRLEYRTAFDSLVKSGDPNLHYLENTGLLGDDDEATVDSSHPTDLGFSRMAGVLEPVIRKLIEA
ncbi:MAG: SGNH/GDSL hydrolase family protein [Thermomicrobiales bacterium]